MDHVLKNRPTRRALLAAAALVLLSPAASAADRIVTDSAGRQVKIPATIERVFVAGPPAAVAVYTLAPDKLIGWPHALGDSAKVLMPPKYAALPVLGRLTGPGGEAVMADIASRHPDLILDVGDVDARYAQLADRVQQRTGVPYLLLDGRLAATAKLYRTLGQILGVPARAAALAAYAETALTELKQRVAQTPRSRRPRVYYVRDADGTQTAVAGSIIGEILDLAAATNVAAAAAQGHVAFEQVRDWAPDIILTSNPDFGRTALADPRWQSLKAVQSHRVYRAPLDPFGWIDEPPGVNRLLGLRWLIAVLYPASGPVDLRAAAREFYARFYHVRLTNPQLATLLSTKP